MKGNLKGLGLAIAALFAMSAVLASTASAHTPAAFELEQIPNIYTFDAHTKTKIVMTGQELTCESTSAVGEGTESTPESIEVIPTYSGCTMAGFSATVTGFGSEGCSWVYGAEGDLELKCGEGDEVTIDAGACTVHVPPQQIPVGTATYTKEVLPGSNKHDLTVKTVAKKVKTVHTDGFLCPFTSSGESEATEMQNAFTARAETPKGLPLHLTHRATVK